MATITRTRDAEWSWDEHLLALDLYMTNPTSPPGKGSLEVGELSRLLVELGRQNRVAMTDKFRNANGVYMKMMNFRRFDPSFQAQGKTGLSRGARGEEEVWDRFANDPPGLSVAAANIRHRISLVAGSRTAQPSERSSTGDRQRKRAGRIVDGRDSSIIRMCVTIENTARNSNGQAVDRTLKNKNLNLDRRSLAALLKELMDFQENRCALTGIPFHYHGLNADNALLPSPDRIDSNGHYERDNLQVVCQFVNRWKSDTEDSEFRRLLALIRSGSASPYCDEWQKASR